MADKVKKDKVKDLAEENNNSKDLEKPTFEETNDSNIEVKDETEDTPLNEVTDIEPIEKQVLSKKRQKTVDVKKDSKDKDKKKEKDSDFNYIVRIANTDIDGEKRIIFGLTQIKGLGRRMATYVADSAGINRNIKCGNLTESQVGEINRVMEEINKKAPAWILNHRKDIDTGDDLHLIGSEVEMRLRDDVNLLKMIRSYRGIRHELGLRVRGQRTRANNRRGLSLGVSKKKQPP